MFGVRLCSKLLQVMLLEIAEYSCFPFQEIITSSSLGTMLYIADN